MRHIKYYIIISCLLLNVTAAVAQTLLLAILTNVKTNNPQLKCTMPTYRVWMQHKGARSWMAPQVSTGLFMTYNINPDMGSYMIGVTQMILNASRLKADSDYMNAMSSVEVENKNYTVNQLNALVKRIITNGLYLIKK
jgi:hypothetical protein